MQPQDPNTPKYAHDTGFLTDYGKSLGLKPVQAGDPANNVGSQISSIPTSAPVGTSSVPSTTSPTTNTGGIVTTNAPTSSNPYLNQVTALSQLSPAEIDAQTKLNTLNANATQGQFNDSQQPIAQGFISGQQAAMQTQANIAQQPLQSQLALAQAQRQSALDAAKAGLSATMPTSLSYGAELVNPVSGATVNGGIFGGTSSTGQSGATGINPATGLSATSSTADILGYLSTNGVNPTRYDMPGLINAIQNGATAQDIISGKVNVAAQTSAGTSGAGYKFDTATQTFVQPNPSAAQTKAPAALGGFASIADVKAFQQMHGLTVDGIVGPQTRAAMTAAGMTPTGGSSGGSSSSISGGGNSSNTSIATPVQSLSAGAFTLLTTGQPPSKAGSQQVTDYTNEVRKTFPDFNPAVAQANSKAITTQIGQQADVSRGITAADSNFSLLNNTFSKTGVNDLNSPLANELANKVKGGLLGNSDVINFQSGVATLQTEYATVLGRGGEVTDAVRKSASNVINGNYSMKDLISLHDYIDKEGKNVVNSYTTTIKNLASGGSTSSTSGGTSSTNPLGI